MNAFRHHQIHKCPDPWCWECCVGVRYCEVCQGGQISLPTDCPGRELTDDELDAVLRGTRDYVAGQWVDTIVKKGRLR